MTNTTVTTKVTGTPKPTPTPTPTVAVALAVAVATATTVTVTTTTVQPPSAIAGVHWGAERSDGPTPCEAVVVPDPASPVEPESEERSKSGSGPPAV